MGKGIVGVSGDIGVGVMGMKISIDRTIKHLTTGFIFFGAALLFQSDQATAFWVLYWSAALLIFVPDTASTTTSPSTP